jgi:hypothetical protein
MRNKANFQKSQMFITVISAMSYNEKLTLDTWSKRTQTNPILPAMSGKIALPVRHSFPVLRSFSEGGSEVEGSVVSWTARGYFLTSKRC